MAFEQLMAEAAKKQEKKKDPPHGAGEKKKEHHHHGLHGFTSTKTREGGSGVEAEDKEKAYMAAEAPNVKR